MRDVVLVAVCGGVGAAGRYAVSLWSYQLLGTWFPFGTLTVNVLGCFLLGLVMQVGLATTAISESARVAIAIGLLGGFTTFSTFGYETLRYMIDGAGRLALANVAANLLLGLAVWAGLATAQSVVGGS